MRGRCRRSRCGIPGETDLQEDARLAVYKLGEDANGELSPEPTRRGDLQDCLRAWSLVCFDFKARASGAVDARGIKAKQNELVCILIHSFGLLGCERTGDQSQPGGGPCMTVFAHGRSSASISRRVHRQLVCALLVLQTTFQGACSLCCIDVQLHILSTWGCIIYFETHQQLVARGAGCECLRRLWRLCVLAA